MGETCGWTSEVEPNDSWQTEATDLGEIAIGRATAEGAIDSQDPTRDVDSFLFEASVSGSLTMSAQSSLIEERFVPVRLTLFELDPPAFVATENLAPLGALLPRLQATVEEGWRYVVVVEHPQSGVYESGSYRLQLDLAPD